MSKADIRDDMIVVGRLSDQNGFSLFPYFSVAFLSRVGVGRTNESALFGYISGYYTLYVGRDMLVFLPPCSVEQRSYLLR
jgi:hypothetical protein